MSDTAKLFWTGRSQAVRLPKAYRFEGDAVRIERRGKRIILEPIPAERDEDPWAWLDRLEPLDDDAVAAALDRPGADHPDNGLDDDVTFR